MKIRSLRRSLAGAFVALLLVGGALGTQVTAAGAASGVAQTDVQYGNNTCGGVVMGAPVIGSVRFLRSGDPLLVRYVMTMGDANTDYVVRLYDGDTCKAIGKAGSFTTDAAGHGYVTSKPIAVAGASSFYAAAIDGRRRSTAHSARPGSDPAHRWVSAVARRRGRRSAR